MDRIRNILKAQYDIDCIEYHKSYDGFYAASYKIITDKTDFFLKCYDNRNTATLSWTANIDIYMPILIWLNNNTPLNGKITTPLLNLNDNFRYDDEFNTYILFEYIDGETIGSTPLNERQVAELGEIMANLHKYGDEIPFDMTKIKEDFSLPFCDSIVKYFNNDYAIAPNDIKAILQPNIKNILHNIDGIVKLAEVLKSRKHTMRLCHTDAHNWNLMQSEHLILVDWEGLKLAPIESDLFMFVNKNKKYRDIFFDRYTEINQQFVFDDDLYKFYTIRRILEDLWAFIESIIYDIQTPEQRARDMNHLVNECDNLNKI